MKFAKGHLLGLIVGVLLYEIYVRSQAPSPGS
jgi:hypothetical protein